MRNLENKKNIKDVQQQTDRVQAKVFTVMLKATNTLWCIYSCIYNQKFLQWCLKRLTLSDVYIDIYIHNQSIWKWIHYLTQPLSTYSPKTLNCLPASNLPCGHVSRTDVNNTNSQQYNDSGHVLTPNEYMKLTCYHWYSTPYQQCKRS